MTSSEIREPTFLVLTALAAGPRHGYALLQDVAKLSEGRVRLKPGTLYGALDRLSDEGLVSEAGAELVDGRQRRYYALTDDGVDVLAREARRMRANAVRATRILRARGVTA
jgi:DNA-binding PadR family transcriptional regulator